MVVLYVASSILMRSRSSTMKTTLTFLVLIAATACGARHRVVQEDAGPPDGLASCSDDVECFLVCEPTCPCPEVWNERQVEELRTLQEYCETHDCFDGTPHEFVEYPCLMMVSVPSCEMPCLPVSEPACVEGVCMAR